MGNCIFLAPPSDSSERLDAQRLQRQIASVDFRISFPHVALFPSRARSPKKLSASAEKLSARGLGPADRTLTAPVEKSTEEKGKPATAGRRRLSSAASLPRSPPVRSATARAQGPALPCTGAASSGASSTPWSSTSLTPRLPDRHAPHRRTSLR